MLILQWHLCQRSRMLPAASGSLGDGSKLLSELQGGQHKPLPSRPQGLFAPHRRIGDPLARLPARRRAPPGAGLAPEQAAERPRGGGSPADLHVSALGQLPPMGRRQRRLWGCPRRLWEGGMVCMRLGRCRHTSFTRDSNIDGQKADVQ